MCPQARLVQARKGVLLYLVAELRMLCSQAPPQMWQPQMQQQMQQPGPPPQAPQSSTPPPSQEKAPEPKPAGDAGGDSGYKVLCMPDAACLRSAALVLHSSV